MSWPAMPSFLPTDGYLPPMSLGAELVSPTTHPFPARGLFISAAGARTTLPQYAATGHEQQRSKPVLADSYSRTGRASSLPLASHMGLSARRSSIRRPASVMW